MTVTITIQEYTTLREQRARAEAAEAELGHVDRVLRGRPALDKHTRAANIEHACQVASRSDALTRQVAALKLALREATELVQPAFRRTEWEQLYRG